MADWYEWHEGYEQPDSTLSARLRIVQQRLRAVLDAAPPGALRIINICAGQGRDLLPVLARHPRRDDVTARLVELDPRNAETARRAAAAEGLEQVQVVVDDASLTDRYADLLPVDVVVACGIFGNISDGDIRTTAAAMAGMCRVGGAVLWTRHRRPPDLVPQVCRWFEEAGFANEWLSETGNTYGVGVHRLTHRTTTLPTPQQMFTFLR